MRFLADENISNLVVKCLRHAGHEVDTVSREDRGAPDSDVLARATSTDCIVITEDQDFGELVVRQKLKAVGILLLELDRLSNALEAERVVFAVTRYGLRLKGNLCVVEPHRIRLRPLNPTP